MCIFFLCTRETKKGIKRSSLVNRRLKFLNPFFQYSTIPSLIHSVLHVDLSYTIRTQYKSDCNNISSQMFIPEKKNN